MDEDEEESSSFRSRLFDMSIKRSNSSPALPLLVNTIDNDLQFDEIDFCDAKIRRHSSSFTSHHSRLSRFAHIMKNEMTNPVVDEVSQERDLHDNLKMSISFTDLGVADEQQPQGQAHTIDSRRSSVNSSDSSPSPSTPARPCAVVSNQRQCYSPALQQQVAPFQCYLASPPSRSQSPIGMMATTTAAGSNNSLNKIGSLTSFPINLKRKQIDESTTVSGGSKKTRIGSDNESFFGPTNSPESPSPGPLESGTSLLTTQQSLQLRSSNTPLDIDLSQPSNSPSNCPSPTNSSCSSSSLTFTPISPASITSSSSSSFLLLTTRSTTSLIVPSAKHLTTNTLSYYPKTKLSTILSSGSNQLQRDRSLDESSSSDIIQTTTTAPSLEPLSVILPTLDNEKETAPAPPPPSPSKEHYFFSSIVDTDAQ